MVACKSPTYLYQFRNSSRFYFRIRTLAFCHPHPHRGVKERYFVRSLLTSKYPEALFLANFIHRKLTEEFAMFKIHYENGEIANAMPMRGQHIKQIPIDLHFETLRLEHDLSNFLRERFRVYLKIAYQVLNNNFDLPPDFSNLRSVKESSIKTFYQSRPTEAVQQHVSLHANALNDFVKQYEAHHGSANTWQVYRDDALMMNKLIGEWKKLASGFQNFEMATLFNAPEDLTLHDAPQLFGLMTQMDAISKMFRKMDRQIRQDSEKEYAVQPLMEKFLHHKKTEAGRSALAQYQQSFSEFTKFFGADYSTHEITRKSALAFKDHLLTLKTNRTHGRSIDGRLGAKTMNRYLTNLNSFCNWVIDNELGLTSNPFSNVGFKLTNKNQLRRRRFSSTEIRTIESYQPVEAKEAKYFRHAERWCKLIAIYGLMRLNEISVLRVENIKVLDGIEFFDLNDHSLKTDNARRVVPIHSQLIKHGFLDYVQQMRLNGEKYLFPELHNKTVTKHPGDPISRSFNRTLLRKIGVSKSDEAARGLLVDFHCFRTTGLCLLKFVGAEGYVVKQLVGHDQSDDVTWGDYAGSQSTGLEQLKFVIELLDYTSDRWDMKPDDKEFRIHFD